MLGLFLLVNKKVRKKLNHFHFSVCRKIEQTNQQVQYKDEFPNI